MFLVRIILTLALTAPLYPVQAHIALWNKGLFGLNWPGQASDERQNWNTNSVVAPHRYSDNRTVEEWFGHGYKGFPPAPGDFMELEAGGTFIGEHSCNRAWTTFRHPGMADKPLDYYACPTSGPLHTVNKYDQPVDPKWFGGTSLAIAYTSDIAALQPTDMIVISVNYTSVWTREVEYQIPCGLPECPEEGCLCTWNWIHQAGHGEGYGAEIYNTLYRCKVSGQTSDKNVLPAGSGTVPVLCEDDPSSCINGPKQPMYVYQKTGNNMDWPSEPPSYNLRYGFKDGAQLDIFGDISQTDCIDSSASSISGQAPVPIGQEVASAEKAQTSVEPSQNSNAEPQHYEQTAFSVPQEQDTPDEAQLDSNFDMDLNDPSPAQAVWKAPSAAQSFHVGDSGHLDNLDEELSSLHVAQSRYNSGPRADHYRYPAELK